MDSSALPPCSALPSCSGVVGALAAQGLAPVLLTGDNWRTARAIASQLGIAEVAGGLGFAAVGDLHCAWGAEVAGGLGVELRLCSVHGALRSVAAAPSNVAVLKARPAVSSLASMQPR